MENVLSSQLYNGVMDYFTILLLNANRLSDIVRG